MLKFTVISGLPYSCKTEISKILLKKDPNSIRISKDELREIFHKGLVWGQADERITLEVESKLINLAFEKNLSIIIDDTNLNPKHIIRYQLLAKQFEYDFEIIESDGSIERSINKDHNSIKKIGRDNIFNMAFKAKLMRQESEYILYGLDGTLADEEQRLALSKDNNGKISLSTFYEPLLLRSETVNEKIKERLLLDFELGYQIIILSYRPEYTRKATEEWLVYHKIPYNRLILRQNNDKTSEADFKLDAVRTYIGEVLLQRIVDNNQNVIEKFNKLGFKTINVTTGELIDA